ncbi:MAG: hypothetical protein SNJ75_10190 [Gemmataceae bacterium]
MESSILHLEDEALNLLLAGDDRVLHILRQQLECANRTREFSGTGYFTYFAVQPGVQHLYGNPSFSFGDITAEIQGLQYGVDFVLHIKEGALAFLEVTTFGENWPVQLGSYELFYVVRGKKSENRDLVALQGINGWSATYK